MRKRLVIGAIAGVAIGLSACVSSHPKAGAVEWHKASYLRAKNLDHQARTRLFQRSEELLGTCGGVLTDAQLAQGRRKARAKEAKAAKHYAALLELGYLAERAIIIRDPRTRAAMTAQNPWQEPFVKARLEQVGTNLILVVTAPASALGKYEEFIRKADAPVYEDTVAEVPSETK